VDFAPIIAATLGAAALLPACATQGPVPDVDFRGPGRLLVVFATPTERRLAVFDTGGSREIEVARPRDARWISPDRILVNTEVDSEEEFDLPATQLVLLDLSSGDVHPVGGTGHRYDPEPSPDGRWLAVGADVAGLGDSDLEIWSLEGVPQRVAVRHQSLEEPRWRPDTYALVASLLIADPESDDDRGGGFGGASLSWPRLHRLRRDLGRPAFLHDGPEPETLAPGGSLPLWWDGRGIWARQRGGLVRCHPEGSGCELVFSPGEERRVVDATPVSVHDALVTSVEASDAFDRRLPDAIHRVDLRTGRAMLLHRTVPGVFVTDIDWIADTIR